jgi:hypothetical protein
MQLSGELNRKQRRKAAKAVKHITKVGSPREKLSLVALDILEKKIESYGNALSGDHKKALLEVCDLYSRIIFGETTGRSVVALDCGLGKTLSVVALVAAIHKLGYDSRSVMICQSRVSELCLMNDALIEAGVPAQKIGLVHSYGHDPLAKVIDGEVINHDGSTKFGWAAKPSNAKDDSSKFQFLLCSHNKLRGKREIIKHTQFRGQPRTITIWDESFISTEATSVGLRDLKTSIQEFENSECGSEEVLPFINWLKEAFNQLSQEELSQKDGNSAKVIHLPHLTDIQLTEYEKLAQYKFKDKRTEWRKHLRDLLGMAADPVRVSIAGGEAVLQFSDAVSKQLTNLVVLDASYRIRELVKIDPTLREPSFFVHRHNLKSYEDVTLHRLNYYGSRVAAETPEKSSKVSKEVALVIKDLPLDEAVCIFTFKWNDQRKAEHAASIRSALTAQGIDLHSTVTLGDGSVKPRFIWKTWGQETGSNNASYCSHLFMVGVLRQQEDKFLAQLVGQSQDLLTDMSSYSLQEAMVSEFAHLVYQASLRSRARIVSHGKALSANLYLVLDEPRIEGYLKEIMRGLQVTEWQPKDEFFGGANVTSDVSKKILQSLNELNTTSRESLSIAEFKKLYDLTKVPLTTFQAARDQALMACTGWRLEGRSFKRIFPSVTQ